MARIPLMFLALTATAATAQAQSGPPAPRAESLTISAEALDAIIGSIPADKESGKPGSFSKRLFSASNASATLIRLNAPDQPHAHGIWSEVFVVKSGTGVLETGGRIVGELSNDSATHRAIFANGENSHSQTQAEIDKEKAAAARRAAQGDLSGTGVVGGKRQKVGQGDVILIPAGVSHRWIQVDQPVVYLDIKFPKEP